MRTTVRRPALVAVAACLVGATLALPLTASAPAAPGPVAVVASDAVRYRPAGPLTLLGPPTARTGTTLALTGTVVVKAKKARKVVLSELVRGQWRAVRSTVSTRRGAYSFRVAAGATKRTRAFRTDAPAARGVRAVRSPVLRIAVAPPGAPDHTEVNDWTYLFDGGSRWNPCQTITWSYDATGELYPTALADVTTAFANIAAESGLDIEYAGASGGDIVVSWANASTVPDLSGNVVGVGGGEGVGAPPGDDVAVQITDGFLTLDNGDTFTIPTGFGHSGWGQIMMHEAMHALGLGHARWFDTQLMWPVSSTKNFVFGAGDITGLHKVGLPAGCL